MVTKKTTAPKGRTRNIAPSAATKLILQHVKREFLDGDSMEGHAAATNLIPQGGKRYGLVIGINEHQEMRLNLRYAANDAQAMHDLMLDPACGQFDHVQLVLNEHATKQNVLLALAKLVRAARGQDMVWIYFAGHGDVEGDEAYWVMHDTHVELLSATGLDRTSINRELSRLKSERVLIWLDCCHADATTLHPNRTRAISSADQLFGKFEGKGTMTLAASDGQQKSVELADVQHGAFTYFLVKGLRGEADSNADGVVTLNELWGYLYKKVEAAARAVGNKQTPVKKGKMTGDDIPLTRNPTAISRREEEAKKERAQREAELARQSKLEEIVNSLCGSRPDMLTVEEGLYCIDLIRQGVEHEKERRVLDALEEVEHGSLDRKFLKPIVARAMRVQPRLSKVRRLRIVVILMATIGVLIVGGGVWQALSINTTMPRPIMSAAPPVASSSSVEAAPVNSTNPVDDATISANTSTNSADPNLIRCDEGIHPFIRGSTTSDISKNIADVTHISQNDCIAHIVGAFPQIQHNQPVLLDQHHALTRTKSVPRAKHEHHYIDSSSSDDGYYHRTWLRTFEIYLKDDFRTSIRPDSLLCAIPDDGKIFDEKFKSCPPSYTNPDVFGGTKLEFDGKMIRYTFGLNQPSRGYKPIIPGINPDVDEGVFFSGDTTLSSNRMFSISIDFETLDPGVPAWSATTTSRAEIIHSAIPKSAFDRIPHGLPQTEENKGKNHTCNDGNQWTVENSWCAVGDYQWFELGATVSVWEVVR